MSAYEQTALWALANLLQGARDYDLTAIKAAFPELTQVLDGDHKVNRERVNAFLSTRPGLINRVFDAKPLDGSEGVEPFETFSLIQLLDGPTEIEWLIDCIIPLGTAGGLIGDGGIGKSWLILELILSIASGRPWLGRFPVQKGRVLVVDEENAKPLLRVRLGQLLRGHGLDAVDLEDNLHFLVGNAVDLTPIKTADGETVNSETYNRLVQTVKQLRPTLVTVDSLTRVHHANENLAHEMAPVFNQIKRIINEFGCTVLFTHHTNKGGSYRGSTDIWNFLDWILQVEKRNDYLTITHDKSRWIESVPEFTVEWRSDKNKDEVALVASESEPQDKAKLGTSWEFIQKLLGRKGKMSRPELVIAAEEAGVCKERKLDDVLKWGHENGYLGKKSGRPVFYWLLSKSDIDPDSDALT